MLRLRSFSIILLALSTAAHAATQVQSAPVPPEMRSSLFTVTVNGHPIDVARAASNYELASFDTTGPADIAITASEPGFWDSGVDIEPWRLGLRAARLPGKDQSQTIRFKITAPAKLSISRPRDFLNQAKMLFLFAGTPPAPPPPAGPNVHIVPAGVHRESINPQSGDTWYLAPGAYIFGSLNLFNVDNVKILGRGTIVYDGPQNPDTDEGWMQKPDWHCVGSVNAHNVEIDGLTCVVRSRTWSIQMKDSTGFVFDDLRVIAGDPANANQDGMDWLGGGDTIIRNSFFRASDDVFATLGNWDGYTTADMIRPGNDVRNILIENSQLSTSISNIVRSGWPQKVFNSGNFTLRNSDILDGGIGACGQPFALLSLWGTNGAKGDHSGLTFENLFLDNWYSLLQIDQALPGVHGIQFHNIWALDQPPLAPSLLKGDVADVTFENVKYGQIRSTTNAELPLVVSDGAQQPKFLPSSGPRASFTVSSFNNSPGDKVTFTAMQMPSASYTWLFGDGTRAQGRSVKHRFPDALGSDLDDKNGAGRFRVLLEVDKIGNRAGNPSDNPDDNLDWASQGVVVVNQWHEPATVSTPMAPGLAYKIYVGSWYSLPDLSALTPVLSGESSSIQSSLRDTSGYATAWDGYIDIPADGGYTFHLIDSDGAQLAIDGVEVAKTGQPFAQVCGSPGNALRYDRGSIGLRAGQHSIHVEGLNTASVGAPRVLWEGPGLKPTDIPAQAFTHPRLDVIGAGKSD